MLLAAAVGGVIWFDPITRFARPPSVAQRPIDAGAGHPDAIGIPVDATIAAPVEAPVAHPLYTISEALEDLASGPLVFIGTGEWFGTYAIHACAYRNSRVIVVNIYCTAKEQPAFSVIVISPTRGHLTIYAESDSAISKLARAEYMTFRLESEPPVPDDPLSIDFTYAELRAWDERRYNAQTGACWSGDGDGCSKELEPRLEAWLPSAKEFLATPPPALFHLVKDMHARAIHDAR
ncbi:MAG TPA: hypothetical protein VGC41_14205 [Kofleriaceae bacterium]